jgi:hypothetical protein
VVSQTIWLRQCYSAPERVILPIFIFHLYNPRNVLKTIALPVEPLAYRGRPAPQSHFQQDCAVQGKAQRISSRSVLLVLRMAAASALIRRSHQTPVTSCRVPEKQLTLLFAIS